MLCLQFKGSTFYVRTRPTANISCIINAKTSTILPFLKCCNHGCLLFFCFVLLFVVLLVVVVVVVVIFVGGPNRRGMLMLRGSNQTTVKDLATGGSQGGI